jgi:hypothetical protein
MSDPTPEEPPLVLRFVLAVVSVALLIVGLSWKGEPGSAGQIALLVVPGVYLLLELWVFVRGLRRP